MTIAILVHVANEEPIACEVDELPEPGAQFILLNNPRRRDGKDLAFLEENVTSVLIPWHRITYVQVLPSSDVDDVIGFVRE